MTYEEALKIAEQEFLKFQAMFYVELANTPDKEYQEIIDLLDYSHPTFESKEDQDLYDSAACVVALRQIVSAL